MDDERQADGCGHHRKRGEGIAHDRGEDSHAEAIHDDRDERLVERDMLRRQSAHGAADTGQREDRAERGQHLRQHRRPADHVDEPAPFLERHVNAGFQPQHRNAERDHDAERQRDHRHLSGIDERRAGDGDVLEEERADEGRGRNDERRHKEPIAQRGRAGWSGSLRASRGCARSASQAGAKNAAM